MSVPGAQGNHDAHACVAASALANRPIGVIVSELPAGV